MITGGDADDDAPKLSPHQTAAQPLPKLAQLGWTDGKEEKTV